MKTKGNGIDIWHQEFGDPSLPPLLLLMGAGAQSLYWPEPLCLMLAEGGLRVIRYDHRDLGESTWEVEGAESWDELTANPPYELADLAGAALGLLDALRVPQAPFAGAWLGGVRTGSAAPPPPPSMPSP